MSPLTDYIIFPLKTRPMRVDASREAVRLSIRPDWAKHYFEVLRNG